MLRESTWRGSTSADARNTECAAVQHQLRGYFQSTEKQIDCYCPDLPIALLRVSRQIYDEALEVLYGDNDFAILCHDAHDLSMLRYISVTALSYMQSLLIRLNCWPCPNGHALNYMSSRTASCTFCKGSVHDADATLSLRSANGRQVLNEWSHVSARLAGAIQPDRLHLSLIADVAGEEEATQVVNGLLKLPKPAQLDFRLGRHREAGLRAVVNQATDQAMGKYRPSGVFEFDRLPRELQWRILEFTELVPSENPEERQQSKDFRRLQRRQANQKRMAEEKRLGVPYLKDPYHDRDPAKRHEEYHKKHAKRNDGLFIRNNKLDYAGRYGWRRDICCQNCTKAELGCCCPTSYGATSAYCICRLLPFDLFYVSKSIYQIATTLFYSRNSFIFHQPFAMTNAFLKEAPSSVVESIREITIMPKMTGRSADMYFISRNQAELADVLETIKARMTMSKLTVTFNCRSFMDAGDSETWEHLYEEHKLAARYMQSMQGVQRMAFRACRFSWDAELERQLRGDKPLDWSVLEPQLKAWEVARRPY